MSDTHKIKEALQMWESARQIFKVNGYAGMIGWVDQMQAAIVRQNAELEELRLQLAKKDALREASQAVIERWDSPLWKDVPPTAEFIHKLREAVAAYDKST